MESEIEIDQYEEELRRTCSICDHVSGSEMELEVHIKDVHEGEDNNEDDDEEEGYSQMLFESCETTYDEDPEGSESVSVEPDVYIKMEKEDAQEEIQETSLVSSDQIKEELYEGDVEDGKYLSEFGVKMEPQYENNGDLYEAPEQVYLMQNNSANGGGKWRKKHKEHYHKADGQWTCNTCFSKYDSNHGIYYHLKSTKCGFGSKTKSKPKKKWSLLYKREDQLFICIACGKNYETIRGVHYHLRKTECGGDLRLDSLGVGASQESVIGGVSPSQSLLIKGVGTSPGLSMGETGVSQELAIGGVDPSQSLPVENGCNGQTILPGLNGQILQAGLNGQLVPVRSNGQIMPAELNGQLVPNGLSGQIMPAHWQLTGKKGGVPGHMRKNYKQFYRKEENICICIGCGTRYYSIHGMHNHLNNTRCGFGDKYVSRPKTNYLDLYRKEDENKFVCLGCENTYNSMHGLHYHLNRTRCGFGHKEGMQTKRNYMGLYTRSETVPPLFSCNSCGHTMGYLTGIHRHLKECPSTLLKLQLEAKSEKEGKEILTGNVEGDHNENFEEEIEPMAIGYEKKEDAEFGKEDLQGNVCEEVEKEDEVITKQEIGDSEGSKVVDHLELGNNNPCLAT